MNGVEDGCEIADGLAFDCDGNGTLDVCDIASGTADDCNVNAIPDFETATEGLVELALDPSRGQILKLLVDTPTFQEQIPMGGTVGYAIIVLGGLAAIVAVVRWLIPL
jgi:hypothetical protein